MPSIPDRARREPEMNHYKRDAFLPGNIKHQEILVWAGIVLYVRSLDVGCRDLLGAIASHQWYQSPTFALTEVH